MTTLIDRPINNQKVGSLLLCYVIQKCKLVASSLKLQLELNQAPVYWCFTLDRLKNQMAQL